MLSDMANLAGNELVRVVGTIVLWYEACRCVFRVIIPLYIQGKTQKQNDP